MTVLAGGDAGPGRLAEPADIVAAVTMVLEGGPTAGRARDLAGRRLVVSAGGTREPIDSVRYIGNRSSGRMGVALAARAAARGAQVTLVAANVAVASPPGVRMIVVRTAAEMKEACEREFPGSDVLLMAAAVADFRPAAPVERKLKKAADAPEAIELERTEDILSALAGQASLAHKFAKFWMDIINKAKLK